MDAIRTTPLRSTHPALFFLLYLPFGAISGYLATPLEYIYVQAGVSAAAFGALVGLATAPHVVKVFWAPLVDTTLGLRAWYVMAVVVMAPSVAAAAFLPPGAAAMPALTALSLVASVASTFCGMACDSLMAHTTAPDRRGAAGGWSQAGNVGGAGLAGGGGLWLAARTHSLVPTGVTLAALCLICAAALGLARSPPRAPARESYLATLKGVAADCWRVSASRPGRLALLLFLLPIGAGGASSIFAAIAGSWGASASVLSDAAWISGVLTSITAIAGGFVCDRMDRKLAYVLFGLVVGVIAAGMAVFPHTPTWFLVFVFAYSAATGLAYAGFAAVTLETIGAGAAATKYNLFASVSNAPVAVMPAVDGWVVTRYGAPSMLWLELAVAVASAVVYLAALAVMRRPRAATAT